MSWNFYIEDYELSVIDVNALSVIEAKESKFRSRANLDGDIVLSGVDYTYMKTLENNRRYEKFTFIAKQNGDVRYLGEFAIPDVFFDDDAKTATFSPTLSDDLTVIQEKLNVDVNCISGVSSEFLDINKSSYAYYVTGFYNYASTGTHPADFSIVWYDQDHSAETLCYMVFVQERMFASKYSGLEDEGFSIIDEIDENFALWGKAPSGVSLNDTDLISLSHIRNITFNGSIPGLVYGLRRTDIYSSSSGASDFSVYASVISNDDDWELLGVTYISLYERQPDTSYLEKEYMNVLAIKKTEYFSGNEYLTRYPAYKLQNVLQNTLSQSVPEFTGNVKSKILFGDPDESGIITDYSESVNSNYITNRAKSHLYVIPNGDFKDPYASNLTTNQQANLGDFLDDIVSMFNTDWYIDNDGNLRIEHVVYKKQDEGINVSDKSTLRKAYSYDTEEIPNSVQLEFSEGRYDDFTKKEIRYDNIPAVEGSKESVNSISIDFMSTDIDGINRYLGALQSDGFILVEVDLSGNIVTGIGEYSGNVDQQNINLSAANLLKDYYRYEMLAQEATMNGKQVNALSLKKVKMQPDVEFVHGIKPDIDKTIITNIGEGEIESMEYQCNDSNSYKLKVLYD